MSTRLREKRNARARNVAALIRDLRRTDPGWDGMACSYGAHDFEFLPGRHGLDQMFKRCRRCGATYLGEDTMTEPEHTEETSGAAAEEEASAEAEQAASSEPE